MATRKRRPKWEEPIHQVFGSIAEHFRNEVIELLNSPFAQIETIGDRTTKTLEMMNKRTYQLKMLATKVKERYAITYTITVQRGDHRVLITFINSDSPNVSIGNRTIFGIDTGFNTKACKLVLRLLITLKSDLSNWLWKQIDMLVKKEPDHPRSVRATKQDLALLEALEKN